jgi:hypothetical protein
MEIRIVILLLLSLLPVFEAQDEVEEAPLNEVPPPKLQYREPMLPGTYGWKHIFYTVSVNLTTF